MQTSIRNKTVKIRAEVHKIRKCKIKCMKLGVLVFLFACIFAILFEDKIDTFSLRKTEIMHVIPSLWRRRQGNHNKNQGG